MKRLQKQAADAERQYEQLRATFPEYYPRDGGLLTIAARYVDETNRTATEYERRLLIEAA